MAQADAAAVAIPEEPPMNTPRRRISAIIVLQSSRLVRVSETSTSSTSRRHPWTESRLSCQRHPHLGRRWEWRPTFFPYGFCVSDLNITPPVVLFLETENLTDLAVGQEALIFTDLAHEGDIRKMLGGKFTRRRIGRYRIIRSIEHLETETALFDTEMNDLTEIASVDIAPGDPLANFTIGEIFGKTLIFVRLDDIADTQRVDVDAEAFGKGAGGLLVHDLGQAVGIHRIDIIVLLQGEMMEIAMAFGKADAIGRLARGDDDLLHAELRSRLDDIVGAHRVDAERLVIGLDQDARDGGEMHHRVERLHALTTIQIRKIAMHGQDIIDLSRIGDIG
ncbi:hypothetical protein RHSP_09762 [Rhizobium freirei PRF 81]|uniref:Uncharacterized protein n=1 Tax=Rhizobium freirei PRF 81 TaxID=363754 RepID=N6TZ53_9HYPH|nr:hypothetical protein RHSP_09762 [Rhizobium freirei PRF 81]